MSDPVESEILEASPDETQAAILAELKKISSTLDLIESPFVLGYMQKLLVNIDELVGRIHMVVCLGSNNPDLVAIGEDLKKNVAEYDRFMAPAIARERLSEIRETPDFSKPS